MSTRRLLGIFAHPDDESFGSGGMLARYAHQDVEVHIATVTDGAAGTYEPRLLAESGAATLAEARQNELQCAAQALGASGLHMLGFRDSGMEGSPDNKHPESLYQADLDVARKILSLICEMRPHVVVTHDPTGGYYHPDHIKTNHAVLRAWSRLDDPQTLVPGCAAWQPDRLYYGVIPCSQLKWALRLLRLMGRNPRRFGKNHDVDLTAVGVDDDKIHVRLDVMPYLPYKEAASACHRTQGGQAARHFPNFLSRRAQRTDYFVQAYPPDAVDHTDLFAGLP